ncbi:MAG: 1,6-anhydro-N-acetylmuramyl-L-alanine amidase AmpD [Gammaproteobacteria bacterium]|nr:1,6-anhydro-N-acetylmuramyl-L-alanine amidase AmpD [Gammaproteobacteria bacterium]
MFEIDISTGRLHNVRQLPSNNCHWSDQHAPLSLIVVHNISLPAGEFGGDQIDRLFTNCLDCTSHDDFKILHGLHVASHVLIDRNGVVTQYVPFSQRAWHAGESCYQGRSACNDFSVGIELEGTDDQAYTDAQYDVLVQLIKALINNYPSLSAEHIVGHSDIAPGRKTDPGPAFDWARLRASLQN